jgi:cyclohexa-1,5-dienecarbonyl-CoA hydratase
MAEHAQVPVRDELLEDGTLLRVLLDRPKGNVLTQAMMEAIRRVLEEHRGHQALRLVVLQGAGGQFSFGASVEEHQREQAPRMLRTFHDLARALAAFRVPVAALVEGRCLGGAFELALCCDLLLASEDAQFGCPEIRLGVFPPVLAAVGPLRLGGMLSDRLLLTGDTVDLDTLDRVGAVTARLGGDPWGEFLEWYRRQWRPLSAQGLRVAKKAARRGAVLPVALERTLPDLERLYVEEVLGSHDGTEGIAAFLERRPPAWKDG